MILPALLVTLLASAGFGFAGPRLSRRLPPAMATWLMSAGGLLAAVASTTGLALVAFRVLAQTQPLTVRGHWSDQVLSERDPVTAPVAVAAVIALTVVLVLAAAAVVSRGRATVAAYRLAADVGGGELCVLDAPEACALAVPGRRGRIMVTSGLLRRLDSGQRRALLTHERAHLRHRHHLHQSATAVAAALNPLLGPLRAGVRRSCERWADEEAATVSSRSTVAQALLRAGMDAGRAAPAAVLAAAAGDVVQRVAALDQPAPRMRVVRAAVLVWLLAAAVVAVAYGMHETERLFELAQAAWRASHR